MSDKTLNDYWHAYADKLEAENAALKAELAQAKWKLGECHPDCKDCFHYDAAPCAAHKGPRKFGRDEAFIAALLFVLAYGAYLGGVK